MKQPCAFNPCLAIAFCSVTIGSPTLAQTTNFSRYLFNWALALITSIWKPYSSVSNCHLTRLIDNRWELEKPTLSLFSDLTGKVRLRPSSQIWWATQTTTNEWKISRCKFFVDRSSRSRSLIGRSLPVFPKVLETEEWRSRRKKALEAVVPMKGNL